MSVPDQLRPLSPRLGTHYAILASVLASLLIVLAVLEQLSFSTLVLSHIMIVFPLVLYVGVSILTRTSQAHEFFCVSRHSPPVFGGLAYAITAIGGTGLIGLTGCLYLIGFDALALSAGWIGGFAIASALLVPYMRKAGSYTLPGFLKLRFASPLAGILATLLLIPPAFMLIVAELKLAGFVTALFASVPSESAIVGFASLVIVATLLGGLRSISWTQSVQYAVALAGLLVPLFIISVQETNLPLPQVTYGWVLEQLAINESAIGTGRTAPQSALAGLPGTTPEPALKPFLQTFGALSGSDFIMLAICILAGTAVLPALLLRAGSTASTHQARKLMTWGTVFLALFLISAPAYAVFAKHLTLAQIVTMKPGELPDWLNMIIGAGLANINDSNADGSLQANELLIARDGVFLSLPIIAGLPFVLVVFAASAGIAAALATAAAHTFAIASSTSNDIFQTVFRAQATPEHRVLLSRIVAAIVVVLAAWFAATGEADVLQFVIAALSITGATFFPAMLLSIIWKRTTAIGVISSMVIGFGFTTSLYLSDVFGGGPLMGELSGLTGAILGIPLATIAGLGVSLVTPRPSPEIYAFVDDMRDPSGEPLFDKATRLADVRNRPALSAPRNGTASGETNEAQ